MRSRVSLSATKLRRSIAGRPRPLFASLRVAFTLAVATGILALTSGCSTMPAAAPTALEVENVATNPLNQITVLDIDNSIISALAAVRPEGFAGQFSSRAPRADLRIAVGDTLQISVIEQSPGLFSTSGGASAAPQNAGSMGGATNFLPVTVGQNGMISVPFAGPVRAAGLTIEALREQIEHKLADKAVNPQVQVALQSGTSLGGTTVGATVGANSATVGGEVNRAGVVPLRPSGSRLLDVIAEASGARYPAFETTIHLTRNHREAAASLQRVVDRPEENVFIYPGDNVYVSRDPKTFTVLGASTKVGRYNFGSETLNLAEAVAEGGGFVDTASDPAGVFVFRYEPLKFVNSLRQEAAPTDADPSPVIYRLNLREGGGYFRARRFAVRDKDIILIANSDGAQLQKFVTLLSGMSAIVANVSTAALVVNPNSTATILSNPGP